jgi:hypothetical protein
MMNMFVPALAANPPNNLNINELNAAGVVRIRMANADQARALNINSEINSADPKRGVGDVHSELNIQRLLPKLSPRWVISAQSHFDSPRTVNPSGRVPAPRLSAGAGGNISLDAAGSYHGCQAEKRFSRGFTFLQTYTWSKTFWSFACYGAQRHDNPYVALKKAGRNRSTAPGTTASLRPAVYPESATC